MRDDELRALVRAAVERALNAPASRPAGPDAVRPAAGHSSHARFGLLTGRDAEGPCLIEPSVRCTHCGYCQSYGH